MNAMQTLSSLLCSFFSVPEHEPYSHHQHHQIAFSIAWLIKMWLHQIAFTRNCIGNGSKWLSEWKSVQDGGKRGAGEGGLQRERKGGLARGGVGEEYLQTACT